MPDLLRERFDALRHAVEDQAADHSGAAGLHDVRARRTRRTRTRVTAAGALAVAALAVGGVVVLPQLTDGSETSASGAAVGADSSGGADSDRGQAEDQAAAEAELPPDGGMLLRLDTVATSLLTGPDLAAVGEQRAQLLVEGAGPTFPPLCDATTGSQQYSDPVRQLSVSYGVVDAEVRQFAAEYGSTSAATAALDRLLVDAQSCPDSNPAGQLSVSSRTPGEIIALSFAEPSAGPNGGPRFTEILIVRSANVLVEVALVPSQQIGLPDGESRVSTVADALLAKL